MKWNLFAKRLADRIEQGRVERRFERLCFVAPPRFLGLLREKCSRETAKLVEFELAKDFPNSTRRHRHAPAQRSPLI